MKKVYAIVVAIIVLLMTASPALGAVYVVSPDAGMEKYDTKFMININTVVKQMDRMSITSEEAGALLSVVASLAGGTYDAFAPRLKSR